MQSIRTLEGIGFEEIARAFNESFADYFFKIELSASQLEDKFKSEGGSLNFSVGVFENEKLVAFILHFVDESKGKKLVYNGGTGVIPEYRGNGLTSAMFRFILPRLISANVDILILEVLVQNTIAIKAYQKQGFEILRELNLYKGQLKGHTKLGNGTDYKIVALHELNWDLLQSFWDYTPTWQNSISTINNIRTQLLCLGLQSNNELIGYAIFNPKLKRIHQMAIHKKFRNIGLGQYLLNSIYSIEKEDVSMINVDANCVAIERLLNQNGLGKFGSQYEMILDLKQTI